MLAEEIGVLFAMYDKNIKPRVFAYITKVGSLPILAIWKNESGTKGGKEMQSIARFILEAS